MLVEFGKAGRHLVGVRAVPKEVQTNFRSGLDHLPVFALRGKGGIDDRHHHGKQDPHQGRPHRKRNLHQKAIHDVFRFCRIGQVHSAEVRGSPFMTPKNVPKIPPITNRPGNALSKSLTPTEGIIPRTRLKQGFVEKAFFAIFRSLGGCEPYLRKANLP